MLALTILFSGRYLAVRGQGVPKEAGALQRHAAISTKDAQRLLVAGLVRQAEVMSFSLKPSAIFSR